MGNRAGLMIWCLIALVLALDLKATTAETFIVGDGIEWDIPPLGSIAYRTWARSKDFELGDTIVFNWTGTHDVAEVTRENYDSCTGTDAIDLRQTSPANFTLTTNSTRYFICTISNHCDLGQKVTINMGDQWSSASSLAVGALSAVLSTIAISFLTFF
ncbi:hypothetical protein I3843_03G229100 [Carya illinoinensis]|uniref:Phytocyanin domain-containing protein n=1 Tax=Carya illinoinensis TaxID=32201 RepID=A0A922FP53_CARIL|nr:stellacyanin-like [Carya illinoinensis]KAG2718786.1 hypothetical protein I3760_03G237300 [Carya illinoinensis]KAG6723962.1 hypothetical protein I3842_03G234900 [Carya illinoinensis]KAG7989250.1 hypothetical protein I3843_03G229100 [Carya illinoinensis]